MNPNPIVPDVLDPAKRVLRTLVQVGLPSSLTPAAGFPALAEQLGVFLSPRMRAALLGLAAAITAAATFLAWLMSIPAVNDFLGKLGLAGHSGPTVELDSLTRAYSVPAQYLPAESSDALAGH